MLADKTNAVWTLDLNSLGEQMHRKLVFMNCVLLNVHVGNGLLTCKPKQLYKQQCRVSGTSLLVPEKLLDSALSIVYSQVQLIMASI